MKITHFVAALFVSAASLTPASAQDADLTILHGVPGLPAPVEVFANGGRLFAFEYGQQEGPLALAPGNYNVDIRLNGQSILSAPITLAADTSYSAIAHLDAGGSPTVSLFTNDSSALSLPASRILVRHTAQAPAVDVALDQNGARFATLQGLSNPNEAGADVPPGVYSASLFVAGTSNRAFGPVDLALEDGFRYIVYAVGDVSGPSFRLLVQRESLTARVRVIHGIPGLPAPVDVFAGNSQLFSFDFTEQAGPLVLNPGTYPLSVRLQGQTVLGTNATVGAGDDVTVIAHLDANGNNVLSTFVNDVTPLADQARLTVRHTAAAPTVDVGLDYQGARFATIPGLSNGGSATAEVPSAVYAASLFAAGTSTSAFGPVTLKPTVGVHYLLYAIGDLNGGSFTVVSQTIDLNPAVAFDLTLTADATGCGPTIAPSASRVAFGETFTLALSGAPGAMGVLNIGDNIRALGGVRLPLALDSFGAPGCRLSTNVMASHPVMLDANGGALVDLVVPTVVAAGLADLYFQSATLTSGNALGVVTSNLVSLSSN